MAKESARATLSLDTGPAPAPPRNPAPIIAALEALARAAQDAGDHAAHGYLSDCAVAAGMLKYKAAAARGHHLSAEADALIERLYKLL